jgi:hypothetical protein
VGIATKKDMEEKKETDVINQPATKKKEDRKRLQLNDVSSHEQHAKSSLRNASCWNDDGIAWFHCQ